MFNLNYKNKYSIDTNGGQNPSETTGAQFELLAKGINSVTPAPGDQTDNTAYYDGGGYSSTDVTGKNFTIAFTGHRVDGDPAQDYIAGKLFDVGDELKTLLKWEDPNGRVVISAVTLTAITPVGGAANAKQTFSFTANFNGAPVVTEPAPPAG